MPDAPSPASVPSSTAILVTDQLEKSSLDDRQYRVIELPNKLEALLVHDPETDKASAALDVNVGNFSDETDMPGMAHAVEHLLFMGTKKFPVENEYGQYLSANSGSANAFTAATSTNYYFDVSAKPTNNQDPTAENPSPLHGALDRFAQFFIEPLFLSSTLDRELKAVDSENQKNLRSDLWRMIQLDKSLSNPNHPYCHFSTGNYDVLKTQPEKRGINVREKFIEFHKKHYSANRMKLVVIGREQLDLLERWVVELFSDVVNKDLTPNRWTEEVPYRATELGFKCFAKSVMDTRELHLTLPIIDEEDLFKSQPSRYLGHLIGHEGPGSIMALLKAKGWANSLSAGTDPVCPGTPGSFEVMIRLTEEGLTHYEEITRIFFQYVSLLRDSPPQEWIFDEMKYMAEVDFRFKQKTPASSFTSRTSSAMQKPLPREWLLSGKSVLREFDPGNISRAIDKLRPDNLKMLIFSQTYPGDWDRTEKWYGTEYKIEQFSNELLDSFWKAERMSPSERLSELYLPEKNTFLPNKMHVEKREISEPAISPRLIRHDEVARTWWKKDDTFWVPKANVNVSLRSPIIDRSVNRVAIGKLFAELVRDALEEYSYQAELAGLQYYVGLDSRGLWVEVSGYNDKLVELLEKVISTIKNGEIKEDRFEIVKERLARGYKNSLLQHAYQQVGEFVSWLMTETNATVEKLATEIPNVTASAVRDFRDKAMEQVHIEVHAHGNFERQEALRATDAVESILKTKTLPSTQRFCPDSSNLPAGSNYVFNKTLKDDANVNNCVETFFHVCERSDRDLKAQLLVMEQMLHEPAFDQLRTKEQLGYVVFTGLRQLYTTFGLRFLIQSTRSPQYLDTRIEAFLTRFRETLAQMSPEEFEGHKHSVIVKRLKKLENLDYETSRHWAHISSEFYDFESDEAQLDAANVKEITIDVMKSFFEKYLDPFSKERARLAVHMHARGTSETDQKLVKLLKAMDLNDVPEETRQSVDLLETYLKDDQRLPDDKISKIVAQAKEAGLKSALAKNDESEQSVMLDADAVRSAIEIKDPEAFKAGHKYVSGGRPFNPLSKFEDRDTKL